MRMKKEEWDRYGHQSEGSFNCTRTASRIMMKKRSGKIINISSVIGITGNAGQSSILQPRQE